MRTGAPSSASATFAVAEHGLVAMLVCLRVGSAAGALCNPPVVRLPAAGMPGTAGAVVHALAWHVSPANAAVRSTGPVAGSGPWLTGVPVLEAVALVVVAWAASARIAARRGG